MEVNDVVDVDEALVEFIDMVPDLAFDVLEEGGFNDSLKFYYELSVKAISSGPSPLGHYVKALLHCISGKAPYYSLEDAKEERLKSAILGNVNAVVDYCSQVDFKTIDSLALCKATLDCYGDPAYLKDDFTYIIESKEPKDIDTIEQRAREIVQNIASKGLKFQEW